MEKCDDDCEDEALTLSDVIQALSSSTFWVPEALNPIIIRYY